MNICMFSPFSIKAPSTHRLLSFAKVLTAKGHVVTIVLPSFDRYSGFKVELEEHIGDVQLSLPSQLKSRKLMTNMIPYGFSTTLNSFFSKSDITHVLKTTPTSGFGYIARLSHGIPVVQDIDDLDHLVMMAEGHSSTNAWIVAQYEKILPKLANHTVVSCSALRKLYLDYGLKKEKVTQISNGVFVNEFDVDADWEIKEHYGLKEKVIVYVGSLNNEAQLFPLIFAMNEVVKERKDTSCLIIGDGTARKNIQELVNKLGLNQYITFAGKVAHVEVPRLLAISDIGFACFPKLDYLWFVSNIKVFEYMAAGLPVVVNAIGDLPFYVDYGHAGVVTNSDAAELSSALLDLLSDNQKRRRLSICAKKYVKNFDWAVLTQKLLEVYKRV